MICPQCKCEYIRGVTRCADCDVALVDVLDPFANGSQEGQEVVSVWEGNDPTEGAAVNDALEKAGIPVIAPGVTGYFIFPSMRPKIEICVSVTDLERAKKVLLGLDAWHDPEELTPEERESLALPESDSPESEEHAQAEPKRSENWDKDDPVAEVWNGDKEDFADTLVVCLREVGIGSRTHSEAGHWRVVVRPEQESRAKEIVREVVEASPPE
jgi:hypothetical protein